MSSWRRIPPTNTHKEHPMTPTPTWLTLLCGSAILSGGIVAGIFFAFSDFIMKSLATIPPASGIEAMTSINRRVYRSIFIAGIWMVAILSAALIFAGFTQPKSPASYWLIGGGIIYILGVIAVSFIYNIPMNHKLEALGTTNKESDSYWKRYLSKWLLWNHARSASAIASSLCYLIAFSAMNS